MAITLEKEPDQVLFMGIDSNVRKVILNRPTKLNIVSYDMVVQLLKKLAEFEQDPNVKLVIIKGNGRAFCAGADVVSLIAQSKGNWRFTVNYYHRLLNILHINATYKKPLVSLAHGFIMGAGAALSMFAAFRIVTENTIFSMPEISLGLIPNVGSNYFLSRLSGYFGEYLGLTGAKIDGADMIACGLATHFVPSKDLVPLECELEEIAGSSTTMDITKISEIINKYTHKPSLKHDSPLKKMKMINQCFSKATVENILSSLVDLSLKNEDELIIRAIKSIKFGSPTNLKIFLKLIREGRMKRLEECLARDYNVTVNNFATTIIDDTDEGIRAMLIEKDKKPRNTVVDVAVNDLGRCNLRSEILSVISQCMWNPSSLEEVKEETVLKHLEGIDNDEFQPLVLDTSRTLNHGLLSMVIRPNM